MLAEGFRGITHRKVAQRAGVPLASVRYYFSNREELILACINDIEMERRAHAAQIIAAAQSTSSDIPSIARGALEIMRGPSTDDARLIGMVRAGVDGVHESPRIAEEMRTLRERLDTDMSAFYDAHSLYGVDTRLCTAIINGTITDAAIEGRSGVAGLVVANLSGLLERYR